MTKWTFLVSACAALIGLGCGDDNPVTPVGDAGSDMIILADTGGGTDTPMVDVPGTDTPIPPMGCAVGEACDPARGCRAGNCIGPQPFMLGVGMDMLLTDENATGTAPENYPVTQFPGGYCSPSDPGMGVFCDEDDPVSCGDCGTCVGVFSDGAICLESCSPSITENGCSNPLNACNLGGEFCFGGCENDDQCRVSRIDTDADGEIDGPAMIGGATADRLEWTDVGNGTCDLTTRRCDFDTNTEASYGDTCRRSTDCPGVGQGDFCAYNEFWNQNSDVATEWGYCTKTACELAGNECGDAGVCQNLGSTMNPFLLCLGTCTPFDTTVDGDAYSSNTGCRAGDTCIWDGVGAMGAADSGYCLPSRPNDVRANNIGAKCDQNAPQDTCHSPYGLGACFAFNGTPDGEGFCAIRECAAPDAPADICGADSICVAGFGGNPGGACVESCTTAADCTSDASACLTPAGAMPLFGIMPATGICQTFCNAADQPSADMQCRAGEVCGNGFAAGTAPGTCVPM